MANKPRVVVPQNTFIEKCVEAGQKGKSLAELAMMCGLSYQQTMQRRKSYIDLGVPLPELADGRGKGGSKKKVDVGAAQALVAQLLGKPLEEVKAEGQALIDAAMENGKSLVRKEDQVQENKILRPNTAA